MPRNEADTRAQLIDPAIHQCGWTEDQIRREETAGTVEIINGRARRRARGKIDYVLRVKVSVNAQPVALALIEAKAENLPPGHGLEQAKTYADCRRHNVKFVFATNGHQFVEFDFFTGLTSAPRPLSEFPSPDALRQRYERGMGFTLSSSAAKPLLQPYASGEGTRRYYQDAAIRAVMEKLAQCELTGKPKRALLSLATGSGKTFIAVNLLKRIADAGQMKRALFLCDRDELRTQALTAFSAAFGNDAAEVFRSSDGENNAKNARIHIATYQTLGVDSENGDASFLTTFYPENYFTHIIIDECHRSAWGKWSQVLLRNSNAAQIGLTATPRQLAVKEYSAEFQLDEAITSNNITYFGEPAYEYGMSQAMEDGYLAACEIVKNSVNLDLTGMSRADIIEHDPVDANNGQPLAADQIRDQYVRYQFEDQLLLPDRVQAMCEDLFNHLLQTGGAEQKTIIFCVRDRHADAVANCLNNLYAKHCSNQARQPAEHYAFKCTAASSGNDQLPDLRASSRSHFIATTVDLLSTGVDVPCVKNIVFFKYLKSPISFYQMVGRGTRIDEPSRKLMFRVYDYTDATRLFGKEFITRVTRRTDSPPTGVTPLPPEPTVLVDNVEVHITDAGRFIVADVNGQAMPVPLEEYKERLAQRLFQETATLADFRARWVNAIKRQQLVDALVQSGYSPNVVRVVEQREDYDLYDVLAELGWGMNPRTRHDRALAFAYKHEDWLNALPNPAAATLRAIAREFENGGSEALENQYLLQATQVRAAGGLDALRLGGNPRDLLNEAKIRMFSA